MKLRTTLVLLSLAACRSAPQPAPPVAAQPVVVIAAGDVSAPSLGAQQLTADLVLRERPDAVLLLGDAQYPDGSAEDFAKFYAPTWGRFRALTYPTPGNHEYKSGSAAAYFDYFGERAGDPAKGYRSFDLGDWHVVALNTNHDCQHVACEDGSAQVKWLEEDLAKTTKRCVLAYWHHPRFNSGSHGDFPRARAFWRVLEQHGVELVLHGHEHLYERMGPMNGAGEPTPDGLVQFTVGTGGIGFSGFQQTPHRASVARSMAAYGVLRLRLAADAWEADFVPAPGSDFQDHAAGRCR